MSFSFSAKEATSRGGVRVSPEVASLFRLNTKKLIISDELIAVRTGLEPATPCVTGMYSNQLNYRTFSIQTIMQRVVELWMQRYAVFLPLSRVFLKKL